MIRLVVLLTQALPVQYYPAIEHPGTAPALRTTVDAVCGNPAALIVRRNTALQLE